MSFSPSLLERVSSLERLALSLVDAIREIKEELKPEEVTVKMEAEDDDPPLVAVENNPAQDPPQLAVRPVVQSQRLPQPPKMMELKFTSRDEVPMISPANFGAVPVPRFSAGGKFNFQRGCAPPPLSSLAHLIPARRGKKTLWLFLLEMLTDAACKDIIRWTGNGHEFRLLDITEIVKRWAKLKNKPAMTYECMSRSLRQYKQSGIMRKGVGNYCYEFMVPPNELLASAIYE